MRPSWEQHAMNIALAARYRSEDPYCQVGAALLDHEGIVLGVGYNGTPSKVSVDMNDRARRRPFMVHAELNALRHAKPYEARGGLMAISHYPCAACCTQMASWGVLRAVWFLPPSDQERYPRLTPEFLETLGLDLRQLR